MPDTIKESVHKCGLIHSRRNADIIRQYIDVGWFIQCRRYIRRSLMVTLDHPYTKYYLRSSPAVRNEQAYHLLHFYHVVHPLSKFCLYRNFIMCFVLSGFYIMLPFMPLYLQSRTLFLYHGLNILQVIFMAEMVMTFFTGFCDAGQIILNPRKIFIRYLKTWLIWDFISIFPFFILHFQKLFEFLDAYILEYWKIVLICENFKIIRYPYWVRSLLLMMEYFGISKSLSDRIGFLARMLVCLMFAFSIRHCLHSIDIVDIEFENLKKKIFVDFYDMIHEILCISDGVNKSNLKDVFASNYGVTIITIVMGFCCIVRMLCLFWQYLNKYFAVVYSETMIYSRYEAYSSYIGLSPRIKGRIYDYLDFKYQCEYYKENIVRDLIMEKELLKEIKMSVYRSRIENVQLFKILPDEVKAKLEDQLTSDIFLPGDVIIYAGTRGNYLYFMVSGTAVVTHSGEIVCCLEDGAHFGEISVILKQKRVTTITAATPCEVLMLKRTDYEAVMQFYPHLRKKVIKQAMERLKEAMESDADIPVCLLYDPTKLTTSKIDLLEHRDDKDENFSESDSIISSLHVSELTLTPRGSTATAPE